MLTFNKDSVFIKNQAAISEASNQVRSEKEIKQEQIRQSLLCAARQAGGICEDDA
ncbi:hypothetical protein [Photobacterium nomapromontoriensis]|uniref:hypothetical protein n=1 Tax=Photobacterium nomapromontoriensis TaxID=2910237 RepID=UPI003D10E579